MATEYVRCDIHDIPDGVRFDVPRRHQGQAITVSYGGFGRPEHDDGDYFMRRVEETGAVSYYRLASLPPVSAEARQTRMGIERRQTRMAASNYLAANGVTRVSRDGNTVRAVVRGEEMAALLDDVEQAAAQSPVYAAVLVLVART